MFKLRLLLFLFSSCALADGSVPGWNKFVYVIYRLEVTNYCGLTDEQILAGFYRERDAVLNEYNFSETLIAAARSEARNLVHAEWSNRGLGGFRGWCRNEATSYAIRFIAANDATP